MVTNKIRYKGQLNWYGEMHIYWRYANNERQALIECCRALAKDLNISWQRVLRYFEGTDRYVITIE